MENASKALLMAAGVLIALMTIGLLVIMFNAMSNTQKEGIQVAREAQVIEFNNQFTTYLRDDVRGSDMISLINRIVSYNKLKGSNSDEQYQEMQITVNIKSEDLEKLAYNKGNPSEIKNPLTQNNIAEFVKTFGSEGLEGKYGAKYITTLSSNISQVIDTTKENNSNITKGEENTIKLLKQQIVTSTDGKITGYKNPKNNNLNWQIIVNDTKKYYQYSQFKRLHFDCEQTQTEYNKNTGRIIKLVFNSNGKLG